MRLRVLAGAPLFQLQCWLDTAAEIEYATNTSHSTPLQLRLCH